MNKLKDIFSIKKNNIITLTGAGGKTSCLYRLGHELKNFRTLLTTTTKIAYPLSEFYDYIYSEKKSLEKESKIGRTVVYGEIKNKKCTAVNYDSIEILSKKYDYTIIEADGSKGLPLKGYLCHEPCIPYFSHVNISIVTVNGIGQFANSSNILRFNEFSQMTGICENQIITPYHMAKWISNPKGMFRNSKGKRILFWNQIEKSKEEKLVLAVVNLLDVEFLKKLDKIVVGSIHESKYKIL